VDLNGSLLWTARIAGLDTTVGVRLPPTIDQALVRLAVRRRVFPAQTHAIIDLVSVRTVTPDEPIDPDAV